MAGTFRTRLAHAWNAFTSRENNDPPIAQFIGPSYSIPPSRTRLRVANERTIIASIYNRIGIDVAAINIKHVKTDGNDHYTGDMISGLNFCLKVAANIDQPARAFRQDVAMTLFNDGVAAIVAVDTDLDPLSTGGYDIKTLRVGTVIQWYPAHVQVRLYNDRKGIREDIILPKSVVAVVENPLYSVMNEPNSTLRRLIRTLNLLDTIDEDANSGKLDLIIQLPYVVKGELKQAQAEQRRKDLEFQLTQSKYGVGYTDGTEKITQLNRPVTSNLLDKVKYLTELLYSELGLTPEVMNGSATPAQMLVYYNRTVEPILAAITESLKCTFLTKTAMSQGQSIMYLQDPFRLIPIDQLDSLIDVVRRNSVLSANDVRPLLGFLPSSDPEASKLDNTNMPNDKRPGLTSASSPNPQVGAIPQGANQNGT